jgi:hypothetical protein
VRLVFEPDVLPKQGMPRWIALVVFGGAIATIAVAALGASNLHQWVLSSRDLRVDPLFLVAGLAFVLATCTLLRSRAPRALQVALVLPIVHLVAVALIPIALCPSLTATARILDDTALLRKLPYGWVLVIAASETMLVAALIAWRRRGEWLHATVILALVQLLLVGLWLPLASDLWSEVAVKPDTLWNWHPRPGLVAFLVVPPCATAAVYTALAIRAPAQLRRYPFAVVTALAAVFASAVCVSCDLSLAGSMVYANLVEVILALVAVAAGGLALLAVWSKARPRPRGRELTGVIDATEDVVASFEIASWLRGARSIVEAFELRTEGERIPIAAGAQLACPLPLGSTHLATGEAIAVLRRGDRVLVSGLVAPERSDPFRTTSAWTAGSDGLCVRGEREQPVDFAEVTLKLWRPHVAYVLVVTAVAFPAIVALTAAL